MQKSKLTTAPEMKTIIILTDRSRSIDYQECHRKRFLGYHFFTSDDAVRSSLNPVVPLRGWGIAPSRLNVYLHDGICVHHGLALLRTGRDKEAAVKDALTMYWDKVKKSGLLLDRDEDPDYVGQEQAALVEACLRAYAIMRLPEMMSKYEVLEVEKEDLFPLVEFIVDDTRYIIGWQSRCDALLLERETGDLFIQSDKTAAYWGDKVDKQNQHDMQGISEVAAVEVRLAQWWTLLHNGALAGEPLSKIASDWETSMTLVQLLNDAPAPPKIQGVRMEFLLKGKRSKDKDGEGPRWQRSPLVRGWMNAGITPGNDQFAWTWNWRDEMGKKKALNYHHWKTFPAWELPGGIKRWVEELLAPDAMGYSHVQREAGSCLEQQFVCPMPYFRQDVDVADWYDQIRAQEEDVGKKVVLLQQAIQRFGWDTPPVRKLLNEWFPQYRRSCDWPDACEFQDVCFSVAVGRDPVGSGLYRGRLPHHAPEERQHTGKLVQIEGV